MFYILVEVLQSKEYTRLAKEDGTAYLKQHNYFISYAQLHILE
jgi:hypothetical protein